MAKADNKTKITAESPTEFIAAIEHKVRRSDAELLLPWMHDLTGLEPRMWGPSIIGYGRYHYKYASGREGDAPLTGFSPRKAALSFYIMPGYQFGKMPEKLARLGKHKLGKSCLYINRLADVDMQVLGSIVIAGLVYMRKNYETFDE
jgi:hypothetical protein